MFSPLARLRHNVIKTGVRIISLSYSRISLDAIADKLGMDSADDAEYIVAKCIRDGVIDATIDHQNRYVASKVRTACQVASDAYSRTLWALLGLRCCFCICDARRCSGVT